MKLIELENIKFPTKKDEDFRKINLNPLLEKEFESFNEYKIDLKVQESSEVIDSSNELIKINERLETKTYELNISEDTKEPIVIVHKLKDENSINTNSLKVNVSEGIKASLIEVFINEKDNNFYSVNREFNINENAHLEYLKIQDMSEKTSLILNYINNLEDNSSINHTNFELGKGFALCIYDSNLEKENTTLNINGYVNLFEKANSSSIFNTTHIEKNNSSNIKYKHILHDDSKAVFEAMSKVNEKALYSKVHQNTDTILLSDDATIFAKPHLEINIDELEASHGATTGSLDKDQLLYLQSRGIDEALAKKMLLKAIENEILDTIQDSKVKDYAINYERNSYV
ncbi:MAG: SufD family Fe-S cluster assembly protein [Campylobacteraceae bacterium]|nr:SufD family Fe-S cluster assembly protein [Campylobacteraceae bacterium]